MSTILIDFYPIKDQVQELSCYMADHLYTQKALDIVLEAALTDEPYEYIDSCMPLESTEYDSEYWRLAEIAEEISAPLRGLMPSGLLHTGVTVMHVDMSCHVMYLKG